MVNPFARLALAAPESSRSLSPQGFLLFDSTFVNGKLDASMG